MIDQWLLSGDRDGSLLTRSERGGSKGGERAGTRVLVVDDDHSILDTVSSILSSEGYQVMSAAGGEEALTLMKNWHPTLVLLDMRMPIMDGWAVARAMREAGSRVPIVVMTAAENARRWADEIGAAGHLAKPFALDDLLSVVERHGNAERRN
ncbi:MAG TPA: response regulator [Candidatus Limnocylindria bacterium]|nr:response regulator [Candidatus Limnocylindria bacterium]